MDIDKNIQEILQRTLPVNDNCVQDENKSSSGSRTGTATTKTDYLSKSINIVGNQNVIIATNSLTVLLLIIFIFGSLIR